MYSSRKGIRISFNAPATLAFVALCIIVQGAAKLAGSNSKVIYTLFSVHRSSLVDPLTYLRCVTHVLGHTGWSHLVSNMMYILLLGPMLEEKYGAAKILEVIGITAVVTGIVNYILFPSVALCGASGVVFAFILLTSFTNVREGEIPLTVLLVALIFIGQQVYEGIFLRDNVSNLSHILGGLVGAAAGYKLNVGKKKT